MCTFFVISTKLYIGHHFNAFAFFSSTKESLDEWISFRLLTSNFITIRQIFEKFQTGSHGAIIWGNSYISQCWMHFFKQNNLCLFFFYFWIAIAVCILVFLLIPSKSHNIYITFIKYFTIQHSTLMRTLGFLLKLHHLLWNSTVVRFSEVSQSPCGMKNVSLL